MTGKKLMSIVDAQLPEGEKCVSVRRTRFSENEYECGAHMLGVWTSEKRYIMAWFTLRMADTKRHLITLQYNDRFGDWELIIKDK